VTLRLAAAVWAVLVIAVAGRVAVAPVRSHTVTPIYWTAANKFARGEPLYVPVEGLDMYLYPPGFAAGVVPFTWLPEKLAGILWRVLGTGLFLAGLWRLGHDLLGLDNRAVAWLMLLPIPLAISSLDNGQANLHMAGLVGLGAAAFGRKRWTAAAGWFAVAVGIKVYPFAAGMLFGVNRRRWVFGLCGFAAAVILFPFVCANANYVWNQFRGMTSFADNDDRLHSYSLARVPRDWTILTRTWLGWVPKEITARIISAVAGIAFAGLVFTSRRKPFTQHVWLAFALGSIWMTLFGPATEAQTYTLLAPALTATVLLSRGWSQLLAVVAWWLFTAQMIRDAFPNGWKMSVYGTQPTAAVLLLLAVLLDAFIKTRNSQPGRLTRWMKMVTPWTTFHAPTI
jgi:hypothetical protein